MVLGVKGSRYLSGFRKGYSRLSKKNQAAVDKVLAELLGEEELPSGRNLKKTKSRKDTWAVRVNKRIRLTFEVADGICILRNVGDHDKTLDG